MFEAVQEAIFPLGRQMPSRLAHRSGDRNPGISSRGPRREGAAPRADDLAQTAQSTQLPPGWHTPLWLARSLGGAFGRWPARQRWRHRPCVGELARHDLLFAFALAAFNLPNGHHLDLGPD